MEGTARRLWVCLGIVTLVLAGCAAAPGVNPTGLAGGQAACGEGPRPILDCRGALQQFARDIKADLNFMSKAQIGFGVTTAKLSEADALTSDLIQHYYQTCTLYNACVITRQDYATKMDKLQDVQLQVRRSLVGLAGSGTQQNIQINPPIGGAISPPPSFPPPPTGGVSGATGFPSPAPSIGATSPGSVSGFPPPPSGFPPAPTTGFPPSPSPAPTTAFPAPPSGFPPPAGVPRSVESAPRTEQVEAVLDILRQGSRSFRGISAVPASPVGDLDSSLRGMLASLKQDWSRQRPQLAAARPVVANITEEGQSFASPVAAFLQDRVTAIVQEQGMSGSAPERQTRGITVKEVAAVAHPNDPKALGTLYNSDLVITGSYRAQGDRMAVTLVALDDKGAELARATQAVPSQAVPNVVPTQPANAADTSQLLTSFAQVGPQAQGASRVELTTNRPGAGASFRLGEEILFFVTSTADGYLYLFHIDGDRNVTRIFPNQYQREARVSAGTALQVPVSGAPFKFEASPPFGLETTFAIVTAAPLDDQELTAVTAGLGKPEQRATTLRSIGEKGTRAGRPAPVWNSVTVLIRP